MVFEHEQRGNYETRAQAEGGDVSILTIAAAVALAQQPYFSMDEAAKAALTDAYNCSEGRRECGGAIYERPKDREIPQTSYFYSVPETSDKPFGVTINALADKPPARMRLVADYHNHLCLGKYKQLVGVFSVADILTNQGFHTVGYMLDGCTGNVHRFDPATDPPDDFVIHYDSGRELDVTEGHVTGWINVYRSVK
jgi:hypothetical protein